jgi:chloride channel protein, CIC family
MAGILSGVVHAPLTAIFLIAEITGGYTLFVPLMIVSALSYFITRYFEPFSVYTKNLAQKGQILTDDKDSNVLKYLKIKDLIETDFIVLKTTDKLKDLVSAFSKSNRNIFPVIDENNEFFGVISLGKAKEYILKKELYDIISIDALAEKKITIDLSESMDTVMEKFEKFNYWNIPVLNNKEYLGFISQSSVLSSYRRTLKKSTLLF